MQKSWTTFFGCDQSKENEKFLPKCVPHGFMAAKSSRQATSPPPFFMDTAPIRLQPKWKLNTVSSPNLFTQEKRSVITSLRHHKCWAEMLKVHQQFKKGISMRSTQPLFQDGGHPDRQQSPWDVPAVHDWQLTGSHLLLPVPRIITTPVCPTST